MALLEIKRYPERVLAQKALPVLDINGKLQQLIDNMFETMYAAPGIGLAAPQVGVSNRLLVIDVSHREDEEESVVALINPEIIGCEGEVESEEGCLSLPGYVTTVTRSEVICVRGFDREGNHREIEAKGLLARALQHEIDHLDGTLLIDRISRIKREFFKKRFQKSLVRT